MYSSDYKNLKNLKDIHVGQVGLLLGNGPSVKTGDLEKFKDFISFACNRIHLAYDQFSFRPTYLLSSDEIMIADFGQEFIEHNKSVFLISKKRPFLSGAYTWIKMKNGRPFKFSKEIEKHIMEGGGTLISAVQIGYHMGIRKFYVYGVDHSFKFKIEKEKGCRNAYGDNNHFIKNYRSGKTWQAPIKDLVEEAFIKCDKIMRAEEGFIVNITRGGKLEVLERKDVESILKLRF
ncbi:MAG: hypothetical protein AAGC64_05890 [Bacteroidota bacterium]